MVLDYLKNYKMYTPLVPNLEEGMEFVNTLLDAAPGRYEKPGSKIFCNVQEGVTADYTNDNIETHEQYLDVQIVFKGQELFQWEERDNLKVKSPYDPATDFCFYAGEGKTFLATQGMFYILFPQDAHKCRGKVGETGDAYRKIVLKLPVEG